MPKVLLIHATDKSLLVAEQPPIPFLVLGLITVATLFPRGWEVAVIDESMEAVDLEASADLVGISTLTLDAYHAHELAYHFRARGIPVLMGGMHPSAMPAEALKHADAVVVGEAENVLDRVLSDFKDGRMRGAYKNENLPDLTDVPRPRFKGKYPPHCAATSRRSRPAPPPGFDIVFCTGGSLNWLSPNEGPIQTESVEKLK